MAPLLTVTEAKQHLNATSDSIDDELQGFIDAATEVVEMLLGEVVVARDFDVIHLSVPCGVLVLERTPVLELTSVASLAGDTTWSVADLQVDPVSGRVIRVTGPVLRAPLRVQYRAGREDDHPARYVMAAKMLVAHWWATQRTPYGGGGVGQQRYGARDSMDDVAVVGGYAVPRAALELLGPPSPLVG